MKQDEAKSSTDNTLPTHCGAQCVMRTQEKKGVPHWLKTPPSRVVFPCAHNGLSNDAHEGEIYVQSRNGRLQIFISKTFKNFCLIFFIFFLLYDLHTKQTTNHQEWGLDRHGEKERARLTVNSIKRLARRQALQYTTIGCWLALLQPRFHPFLISAALLAVCGRSSYCCILVAWPLAKPYPITSFKPGFCCRLKELQNPLLSVV